MIRDWATRRLGSPLRDPMSAALLVGAVAAMVYANALGNLFAYDDYYIVVQNTQIQDWATLPTALLQPYWPTLHGRELGLWRPVTIGLLGVQHIVGGGSALLFHAFNVGVHAITSSLVVLLLTAMTSLPVALVAGLVFAIHPVHVEAVANVVGISELVSTCALLAACLVHVRGADRTGWRRASVIGLLYALGFGAKESAVTLPGLIFLLDAARGSIGFRDLGAYLRDRWREYLVLLLVAGALLAGRYYVLGSIAEAFAPIGAGLWEEIPRIWTLAEVWSHYVRLWIFPMDLSSDYSPNVIPISIGWNAANLVGLMLALVGLTCTLIAWRRREMGPGVETARIAGFGVVWFMIAISPISNVFFVAGVLLAERTLYLPTVGLAAATGWLAVRLFKDRPRAVTIGLVAVLALGTIRTWTRTPTWKNNRAVFDTLLGDNPHSGRAQWIIGDSFMAGGNVHQGLLSYRAAINLLGGNYKLVTDIAQRLITIERYRAAENLLHFAWRDSPQFAMAPGLLAAIHAEQGDAPGTERYARASIAVHERDAARHYLLAWALAKQGRWDEAAEARQRGEELLNVEAWWTWMYLARVRQHEGDSAAALAMVDKAWARTMSETGRTMLDSVRIADFGLKSLHPVRTDAEGGGNR